MFLWGKEFHLYGEKEIIILDTLMVIIKLLGGLGLFIYGMKLMGDGLENAAGSKLKSFFDKAITNPLKGALVGTIVTAIIQSLSLIHI